MSNVTNPAVFDSSFFSTRVIVMNHQVHKFTLACHRDCRGRWHGRLRNGVECRLAGRGGIARGVETVSSERQRDKQDEEDFRQILAAAPSSCRAAGLH